MGLTQHEENVRRAFWDVCSKNMRELGESGASPTEVHALLIDRGQAPKLDTVIDIADTMRLLASTGELYRIPFKPKEVIMTDKIEDKDGARTIELSHFAVITLNGDGTGSIDGALINDRPDGWEEDPFHVAVDNLFGLALLHALAGIDVGSRPYERGFEQQLNELVDQYGED